VTPLFIVVDSPAAETLSGQLRVKRSEMMVLELEGVALRLFTARGFDNVTVDQIASEAHTSARTFYRYFPAKEDVLQVQIDRRMEALQAALQSRPADEAPLRSLRLALAEVAANEDTERLRRWTTVVAASPSALKVVLGAIQLKSQPAIAEFFGSRLGVASDDFIPVIVAGAIGGVVQAAHTQWFVHGGDFAETMEAAVDVLERVLGSDASPLRP
jgi:TetR/AcrR family transcriptional regulator, regulator of mycofactocin system